MLGVAALAMVAVTIAPLSAQLANAAGDASKAAPKGDAKGGAKGGAKGKGKANNAGPTPRIGTVAVNQPDFGGPGVWNNPYITNMSASIIEGGKETCENFPSAAGANTPSCAPFTPKGREVFAARRMSDSATDPEGFCLPPGVPRMSTTPYPWTILQTPQFVAFLYEGGAHVWRKVFMGRQVHDPIVEETWLGDSIGWWEGDTLVVETTKLQRHAGRRPRRQPEPEGDGEVQPHGSGNGALSVHRDRSVDVGKVVVRRVSAGQDRRRRL